MESICYAEEYYSGAQWIRKYGYLCIREGLVVTGIHMTVRPSTCSSVHTTGILM